MKTKPTSTLSNNITYILRNQRRSIMEMTVKQKIGQLFMVGFDSTTVNSHIETLIRDYNVGNVILFERNCKTPQQTFKLVQDLQRLAIKHNGVPMFIGIDQENGMVVRISDGVCQFPTNMAQTKGASLDEIYHMAKYTGEMLGALGINYNLAPCLDINNNKSNPIIGIRSFGEDSETVATAGVACIDGFQSSGIIATAKHFPGHGDTSVDSHLALPVISYTKKRLNEVELYPFKVAIKAGVKSIMTTHIRFMTYDDKFPATLSQKVLTDLLRVQLGFKGLIITDCLEMKAIDDTYSVEKAAPMAIKAGADIICISHTQKLQTKALIETIDQFGSSEILQKRVISSCHRIIAQKSKLNIKNFLERQFEDIESVLNPQEAIDLAKRVSKDSVDIIQQRQSLPLAAKKILVIAPNSRGLNGADGQWHIPNFASFVKNNVVNNDITAVKIENQPTKADIRELVNKTKEFDTIIMCLYNAQFMKPQLDLAQQILDTHHCVICISMRNPYDINYLKNTQTVIQAYEYTPLSMSTLMEMLFNIHVEYIGEEEIQNSIKKEDKEEIIPDISPDTQDITQDTQDLTQDLTQDVQDLTQDLTQDAQDIVQDLTQDA